MESDVGEKELQAVESGPDTEIDHNYEFPKPDPESK